MDHESGTARWWLARLGAKLAEDVARIDRLDRYDCGAHPFPAVPAKYRRGLRDVMKASRSNYCGLVADAVLDLLTVTGFRMGDDDTNEAARQLWQRSQMDADQALVHRNALSLRRAYVMAGLSDGVPRFTSEDPRHCIHESDPADRRRVVAGLKSWKEATGELKAVVYLPDQIHHFVLEDPSEKVDWGSEAWLEDENEMPDGPVDNPTAPVVPLVPFINRPEKSLMGFAEFEDVTDIQDRINQTMVDRIATSKAQGFKQRWVTGIDLDELKELDPGIDVLWGTSGDGAKWGEFGAADLTGFVATTQQDVAALAAITRTPPHYLIGEVVNVSGDALTAAQAGLVAKTRRRMAQFGESWEAVIALGFMLDGRDPVLDAETIWEDPERQSPAVQADAAVKKSQIGVPMSQLLEDLGYSQAQIVRIKAEVAGNLLMAQAFGQLSAGGVPDEQQPGVEVVDAVG